MEVRTIQPKERSTVSEGVIFDAIDTYVKKARFPRNLLIRQLKSKEKQYLDKIEKAKRVKFDAEKTIESTDQEIESIKSRAFATLNLLREEFND